MKKTSKWIWTVVALIIVAAAGALAYGYVIYKSGSQDDQVAFRGVYACLPLKIAVEQPLSGCLLGFKTGDEYYAIDTTAIQSSMQAILSLPDGTETMIYGSLLPVSELDSDTADRYDVKGLVIVTGASSV